MSLEFERALVVVEYGFEFVLRHSNVFFVSMACGVYFLCSAACFFSIAYCIVGAACL